MSSLLKEAIVDANALREAALKNAESAIIDKYSDEVHNVLNKLLEQDELADLGLDPAMGAEMDLAAEPVEPVDDMDVEGDAPVDSIEEDVEDVPYAATDDLSGMDGKNLKNIPGEGEDVEVTLDLGALRESVEALQAEIDEDLEFNEDDLAEMLSDDEESTVDEVQAAGVEAAAEEDADVKAMSSLEGDDDDDDSDVDAAEMASESMEISEELIDEIVEKLTVDMGASLSGWAGRSSYDTKYQMEKELAKRRSTDIEEDLEDLKKAKEELTFENKQLKEQILQYKQVTLELKETLQNVNLSNARLLYTNRVLRNTSLNERQKSRIAEAISRADSVTEAKTIYNTLESTVAAKPSRSPQSLSEAITRPSSVIRASRNEAQAADPFLDRMRKLAGIK